MAGTNQAANLGGMLSQIGGSLRAGVSQANIDKLGGNIERMSKPDLDMNDPESIKRNAQWYHDTGKDREAMAMGEKYSAMEKQKAAQENMANALGMFGQADKNANIGNLDGFDTNIAAIRKAAAQAPDAQTQLQLHNMANQAAAGRDGVVEKHTQVQVGNIAKIDGILGNEEAVGKMDPRAIAGMKEARAGLYAQPRVREAYDGQQLKQVQQTAQAVTAQSVIDNDSVRKQYSQLEAQGDPKALEAFKKQVGEAGNGDIISAIETERGEKKQFDMEMQEMLRDESRKAEVPSTLSSLMTALPNTPQTAALKAAYDGLEKDITAYNDSKGKTGSQDVYSGQSLKQIEAKANTIFGVAASMSTSKAVSNSSELKGFQAQKMEANKKIATILGNIKPSDIEAEAQSLLGQGSTWYGGTSSDDNPHETRITVDGVEMTAWQAAEKSLANKRTKGLLDVVRQADEGIARLSGPSELEQMRQELQAIDDKITKGGE